MQEAIPKTCANFRICRAYTTYGNYCDKCRPPKQDHRKQRDNFIYSSVRWRNARVAFLADNPFCVAMRDQAPCNRQATEVDHITPISAGGAIWDRSNWQSLCRSCHSRKTARENGGFGNRKH